jgi:acyl-coenzyme A synthetase/AMP-(fatty) acid ligase
VVFSLGDYHTMSGFRNPCVATVHAGACTLVAASETRQHPRAVAACMARHGVSVLALVPQAMKLLLAGLTDRAALAGCRLVLCTGDRLPLDLREAFTQRFEVPVRSYYGLTETAGICLAEVAAEPTRREGNLGVPVDADVHLEPVPGHDCADQRLGELWIGSRNLMSGYLDDPGATAQVRQGRWLRTGDLVRREPDGQLTLVARLRHIVKNAHGEIVSPAEIEDALRRFDGVADAWAGPVGPTGRFAALVVPAGGLITAEWEQAVRSSLLRTVGSKRMPALVKAVAALPRVANGKICPAGVARLLNAGEEDQAT